MKTAICMIVFGAIGMLGTGWLGAAMDDKWIGAIFGQFAIFLAMTMGGIYLALEAQDTQP